MKLLQMINKVKQKYSSLRQACRIADISWTKFHRHIHVKSEKKQQKDYICKLSQDQIESIMQGLVDLLMSKMSTISEHIFMASWNYVQYKQARRNILIGDVILVHDFAQNYLCQHQKEVQGLHWRHEQVTVMPTVVHYKCVKCHQLTTHKIVHVSEDLKHDVHLVKAFTARTLSVLRKN